MGENHGKLRAVKPTATIGLEPSICPLLVSDAEPLDHWWSRKETEEKKRHVFSINLFYWRTCIEQTLLSARNLVLVSISGVAISWFLMKTNGHTSNFQTGSVGSSFVLSVYNSLFFHFELYVIIGCTFLKKYAEQILFQVEKII